MNHYDKLIFLDLDGVLNCHLFDKEIQSCRIDDDKVFILNKILKKTNAKIILSSAWRYLIYRNEMNLKGMEWLFRSHGILANRLIGITREDTKDFKSKFGFLENERGKQIGDFLKNISCNKYVVIDDLDLGINDCKHPFVQIDGKIGLSEKDIEKVVKILN